MRPFFILLTLLLVPFALACHSECTKQSDCNTDGGELCLWPAGVGCGAVEGHCEKQNHCATTGAPPQLCSCSEHMTIAPNCIPSNGISEQTTNGACEMDGGSDDARESEAGED